jgi:hypothetical protein
MLRSSLCWLLLLDANSLGRNLQRFAAGFRASTFMYGSQQGVLSPITEASTDVDTGLSAWWSFNGNLDDLSGNERHARTVGGPAHLATRGSCGRVLSLRGPNYDDHLIVQKSAGLDLGPSFTFAVWVLLTRSNSGASGEFHWQTIFDNGESGKFHPAFGMRLLGGTVAVDFRSGAASVAHNYPAAGSDSAAASGRSDVAVTPGEWTHVAFTYDGGGSGNATFYINAVVAFSEKLIGARRCQAPKWDAACAVIDPPPAQGALWIGREAPNRRGKDARALTGSLGDVRIYGNRALGKADL